MTQEQIGALFERWVNDESFRKEFRRDPEGILNRQGISLTEDEWRAVRKIDWNLPDQELKARISKI